MVTTEETGGYDNYKRVSLGIIDLEKGVQDFAFDVVESEINKLYVMQLKGGYLSKK